jgi:hypothetical protein
VVAARPPFVKGDHLTNLATTECWRRRACHIREGFLMDAGRLGRVPGRHGAMAEEQYVCSECGITYSRADTAEVCEAMDRNNRNLNQIGLGFRDPAREALDNARANEP